ncbi:hypothetical protein ACOMHN_046958 [Nucella lapillus]
MTLMMRVKLTAVTVFLEEGGAQEHGVLLPIPATSEETTLPPSPLPTPSSSTPPHPSSLSSHHLSSQGPPREKAWQSHLAHLFAESNTPRLCAKAAALPHVSDGSCVERNEENEQRKPEQCLLLAALQPALDHSHLASVCQSASLTPYNEQ